MPFDRPRSSAIPQLEIIRGSDDTVRAELIALPVVRTDVAGQTISDTAAATALSAVGSAGFGATHLAG